MSGAGFDSQDDDGAVADAAGARSGRASGSSDAEVVSADIEVVDAEVLPASRARIATERGRVFDASGRVEVDPGRWRPFGNPSSKVAVQAEGGCAPGISRWLRRGLGFGLLIVLALTLLYGSGMTTSQAVQWLRDSGLTGRVVLVGVIALVTPFFVPSGLMAVLPGYLWGTIEGTALILIGAALGGVLNMWLARRVVGPRIEAFVGTAPMLGVLLQTIRQRGFRIALALRMSPVTPYSMLAYLAGIAGLSYGKFVVASLVGGIPWTSVYAMAGALLASTSQDLQLGAQPELGPHTVWLRWVGLAFTIIVAVWIGRAARADLAKMRAESSEMR
ncbi:MAG: TVP38/TMEM64 family protein [Myxococcales bacterium]|nr:TVP38/TMEM64 family protein [Myxococcales bacterium]